MQQATSRPAVPVRPQRVLFLEINEAERHFLETYAGQGHLPAFRRALDEGVLLNTRIPGWDARKERAWRDISPWIIWPSVYTGLLPAEHGIVGFGQDTSSLRERCVWDVLDRQGVSTGIFGCLMSYPPRSHGAAKFYVPEALADSPECFPEEARPVQEFSVLAARNYSEGFGWNGVAVLRKLLRSMGAGVSAGTVAKTLLQIPAEKLVGAHKEPERAMLASYIGYEAFKELYARHQPQYAALHLNHVAYVQHRYWRAAEPNRFAEQLSETDRRFFDRVEQRKRYEQRFADWILKAFRYTDRVLGEMMASVPDDTLVLVGTGLGVRPFDPCSEIHNPVVRLVRERELFDAIGLSGYQVLHQMNPDVTVNFRDEDSAAQALEVLGGLYALDDEGLFAIQRRGKQLFLELNVPRGGLSGPGAKIRHRQRPGWSVESRRHIAEHWNNDQSTSHHKDVGLLLAWCKGRRVTSEHKSIAVTDIAPTILAQFGIEPQPWHRPEKVPAFRIEG